MKVIFIEDVPNIARVGQTRTVADGYARNYLFPRKLAVLADSQAATAIEAQLKKKVKQRELEDAEMAELAKKIEGIEITLEAKVGEKEKLYGSITSADIAEALSKVAGNEIDKKKIDLPEPIKQAGSFDVTVKLAHEISTVIKVNVISDEPVEEQPAEAGKPEEEKEKAEKKEKKVKKAKEEVPVQAEKEAEPAEAVKEKKPAKKKAKATKAKKEAKTEEEAKPADEKKEEEAEPAEAKKKKKPRAKVKKAETKEEEKEES